jgi:hypothetical protein
VRFLLKDRSSRVLAEGLVYKDKGHNDQLLDLLLDEQHGFCAYTEKRSTPLDTCAVEHFDTRKKRTAADDYFNYYAVLQSANQRKRRREQKHRGAAFFESLFFQKKAGLSRIRYLPGEGVFEETYEDDHEARDLVDFLGFNDEILFEERRKHVERLRELFREAEWGADRQRAYLNEHPEELSFVTALEAELGLPELLSSG